MRPKMDTSHGQTALRHTEFITNGEHSESRSKSPTRPFQREVKRNDDAEFASAGSRKPTETRSMVRFEDPEHHDDEDTRISVSSSDHSAETNPNSPSVCICQHDPKIPRPRNAFILYRQAHQAAIVARNPGLTNPEISKIIGEQWTNLPACVKNDWKQLAEEEKQRHQRQYPDYRYQPKRSHRRSSSCSNGTADSNLSSTISAAGKRCDRCGGRTMVNGQISPADQPSGVRRTSSTTTTGQATKPIHPLPTPTSAGSFFNGPTLPRLSNLYLHSPQNASAGATDYSREQNPPTPFTSTSTMGSTTYYAADDRDRVSDLPEPKRRRGPSGAPYAGPGWVQAGTPHPYTQPAASPFRSEFSNGEPVVRHPSIAGSIGPPLAYPPQRQPTSYNIVQREPKVVLPPLRSHGRKESGSISSPPIDQGQNRSVEAMIMSMSFTHKLRALGRIAPPLKIPESSSPISKHDFRGAYIAVEGADEEAVTEVLNFLKVELAREENYRILVGDGPRGPKKRNSTKENVEISDYLTLIAEWHEKSRQMVELLTDPVPNVLKENHQRIDSDERCDSLYPLSKRTDEDWMKSKTTNTDRECREDGDVDMDRDSRTKRSEDDDKHSTTTKGQRTSSPDEIMRKDGIPLKQFIPLQILQHTSYYASDAWSSIVPIQDAYSPIDHWQWMATMWRGIIGPDLIIFVTDPPITGNAAQSAGAESAHSTTSSSQAAAAAAAAQQTRPFEGGGGGSNNIISSGQTAGVAGAAPNNLKEKPKAVEVREDLRCIIVRKERNGEGSGSKTMIGEKNLRRLGFEVGEWVRNVVKAHTGPVTGRYLDSIGGGG